MLMFSFIVGMCSCTDRHEPSPGIRDVGNGTAGGGPIPAGETFSRASRIRDVVSDPESGLRRRSRPIRRSVTPGSSSSVEMPTGLCG